MERVGVRELRQNLSVYLRRVRRGESLEVTDRGHPVAVLQPIAAPDDAFARLAARGIRFRRGAGNLVDLPPPGQERPLPPAQRGARGGAGRPDLIDVDASALGQACRKSRSSNDLRHSRAPRYDERMTAAAEALVLAVLAPQ